MAAVEAEARGRGLLRPFHRGALSAWHPAAALAPRQGAAAMHPRSGEAEEGQSDGSAEVIQPSDTALRRKNLDRSPGSGMAGNPQERPANIFLKSLARYRRTAPR